MSNQVMSIVKCPT